MLFLQMYVAFVLALATDRLLTKYLTRLPKLARMKKDTEKVKKASEHKKKSVMNSTIRFLEGGRR